MTETISVIHCNLLTVILSVRHENLIIVLYCVILTCALICVFEYLFVVVYLPAFWTISKTISL